MTVYGAREDDTRQVVFERVVLEGKAYLVPLFKMMDAANVPVGPANPLSVVASASEALVGLTGTPGDVLSVTPTLDTGIYAQDEVLFDTAAVAGMFRVNGGRALVQSLAVIDSDDQGVAFDLFFLQTNVSLGTFNTAPSISDANAAASCIRRICRVEATDYLDLGGCRVANKDGIGAMIEAAAGGTTGYLAAITRGGTPTYTAAGLLLRLGLIWF